MSIWQFLFSFQGRFNRAKYWAVWGGIIAAGFVIALILIVTVPLASRSDGLARPVLLAIIIPGIALYIVSLASAVKRLHDRNKSGWWALLFVVLPSGLDRAAARAEDQSTALAMSLIALGLGIWAIVELGFLRGTVGRNRFGPDPLLPNADLQFYRTEPAEPTLGSPYPDTVGSDSTVRPPTAAGRASVPSVGTKDPQRTADDMRRWELLKEVDPDIAAAAARVAALGPDYEQALAEKYFSAGERKEYLERLVVAIETFAARSQ